MLDILIYLFLLKGSKASKVPLAHEWQNWDSTKNHLTLNLPLIGLPECTSPCVYPFPEPQAAMFIQTLQV